MSVENSTEPRPVAPSRKKRGRETAGDMIRSLLVVFALVVPLWFLAQPPKSDSQTLRVVDPTADVSAFRAAAPGVPTPTTPAGWKPTSSTPDLPASLRIGYVVPGEQYAEYAASTGAAGAFLPGITGNGSRVGSFTVGGTDWQLWRDGDGHTSLVQTLPAGTVVVGGVRETASLDQLRTLALTVR